MNVYAECFRIRWMIMTRLCIPYAYHMWTKRTLLAHLYKVYLITLYHTQIVLIVITYLKGQQNELHNIIKAETIIIGQGTNCHSRAPCISGFLYMSVYVTHTYHKRYRHQEWT